MLAKEFRLPLKTAKNQGFNSLKGDYFVFKKGKNNLLHSRFGVIISGKILKSAVKRNKVKRIVFNYVRINKLHLVPGYDFVLIALPSAARVSKKEIEAELAKKFK